MPIMVWTDTMGMALGWDGVGNGLGVGGGFEID